MRCCAPVAYAFSSKYILHIILCLYVCIYMYTYIYIYMFIKYAGFLIIAPWATLFKGPPSNIYIYIYMYIYVYIYVCIYMYIYIYGSFSFMALNADIKSALVAHSTWTHSGPSLVQPTFLLCGAADKSR